MKKIQFSYIFYGLRSFFCGSLLLFICFSCEQVVDIDLQETPSRIVIEANFTISPESINPNQLNGVVKLSQSTGYYDTSFPVVTSAQVRLLDDQNNTITVFSENPSIQGTYVMDTDVLIQMDKKYTLVITTLDNKTYSATSEVMLTTPITSLTKGERTFFNEEQEVIATITDIAQRDDYYLFIASGNDGRQPFLGVDKDQFSDGIEREISFFYSDVLTPLQAVIEIIGMDKEYYNYMSLLIEQNGQQQRSPFEAIPATVIGNFLNIADQNDVPLGYFRISQVYRKTIQLELESESN